MGHKVLKLMALQVRPNDNSFIALNKIKGSKSKSRLLFLLALAWAQQDFVDVRHDTSGSNGDVSKELVQFFIVPDRQHDVTRRNSRFLVITCRIPCKLQNFHSQVLQNCGKEHWCASTNTISISALTEETMQTTHRELQACPRGPRLWMLALTFDSGLGCSLLDTLLGWH
jgi:hypothetical protein